jgi:hypothetical protein
MWRNYFKFILKGGVIRMNRRKVSTQVLLSFFIMMLLMVIGCSSAEDAIKDALPIHKISGTVYDSSKNVVTTSVTVNLTGESSSSTSTDNNGKYEFDNLKNGTYTVSAEGYNSKTVTISNEDVTANLTQTVSSDGTASGTWSWNSTTSTLTFDWTNVSILCSGPSSGIDTQTGVTIGTTKMTWVNTNNNMTWNRSSGTKNDPTGTWTSTDSDGNTYKLEIDANGNLSVSAHIISCGSSSSSSSSSSGGPTAGNYTMSCTMTVADVQQQPYSSSYTVNSGDSYTTANTDFCSNVTSSLTQAGCSSPSCNISWSSSTSAGFSFSGTCNSIPISDTCTISHQ